jgi:hypothetical protein
MPDIKPGIQTMPSDRRASMLGTRPAWMAARTCAVTVVLGSTWYYSVSKLASTRMPETGGGRRL